MPPCAAELRVGAVVTARGNYTVAPCRSCLHQRLGIKLNLNTQVTIKNLQNTHEKSLPPTGARRRMMELEHQDWARLQGRGPHRQDSLLVLGWYWPT